MNRTKGKALAVLFLTGFVCIFLMGSENIETAAAFSDGPPPGFTGAPGESDCTACHIHIAGAGTLAISAPQNYTPGQSYQIVVSHVTSDATRVRWGFQLTPLAGTDPAGTLGLLSDNTQLVSGQGGRVYVEHTTQGTFAGQTGGAVWTFNWTAPQTDVGPVTFYAAGNQANNDGNSTGDRILTATATSNPAVTLRRTLFDFDGDGKTDIGITRPNGGIIEWWLSRSLDSNVFATVFGVSSDVPAPADFTGDGKTDIAVFRPSTGFWYVLRSEDLSFLAFPFGTSGDIPMPADYDADGKADPAVFRPSSATWFISRTSDGQTTIAQFGAAGDLPVAADYDGDGRADIAIYRENSGIKEWWIQRSAQGLFATVFGVTGDRSVQGDYTGDGKTDIAVWRPSNGNWFILRSEDLSFLAFPWGATGDLPAPGDYDGDGKWDATVFRPSSATWFVNRTGGSGPLITAFGAPTDSPVAGVYVR